MKNEEAIKDLKEYIQLWEDEQADEDLTVIIYKNTIESFKIAKQALEKQINNPLTLDEVKELKYGDIVWLKYIKDNYLQIIQFVEISGAFLTFDTFGNEMLCNRFFSGINKVYEIYRNKPEEVEE